MTSFKEFMAKKDEGLQTTLGQRSPSGVGRSAGKFAADVASDFIPGGGLAKSAGEFLWDVIGNRRHRVNFAQLNQRATRHKQALTQQGIDPNVVFRLDDNLAKMLSDQAIYGIMEDTLGKLDAVAQNGYRGLPKGGNLVEMVALNKLRPFVQSLMGGAPNAVPA